MSSGILVIDICNVAQLIHLRRTYVIIIIRTAIVEPNQCASISAIIETMWMNRCNYYTQNKQVYICLLLKKERKKCDAEIHRQLDRSSSSSSSSLANASIISSSSHTHKRLVDKKFTADIYTRSPIVYYICIRVSVRVCVCVYDVPQYIT